MQALLLVGHGSTAAEGNAQFLELVERVKAAASPRLVEHCFIELAEPGIDEGIAACVQQGATEVAVLPMMLLAANHAKVEVPEYLERAREQYPQVTFHYGRPFGINPVMMQILADRFAEVDAQQGPFERAETAVILVGRGCSDVDANSDLAKIARILLEQTKVGLVETCYAGVTVPDLPSVFHRVARLGYQRVVVLPYFLFTGVLMRRIEEWTRAMEMEFPNWSIHLGRYFGDHPRLVELILTREQEALAGTAYLTRAYDQFPVDHHHDHHHHHDERR